MSNNMRKCLSRDRAIVNSLDEHAILCTEQIACLHFKGQKYPLVSCRRRLRALAKTGRITRKRFAPYASNVYTIESWPRQWEHRLGINWFYCWLHTNLAEGEQIYHWQTPHNAGDLRPDALYALRSASTYTFGFLEYDRATNAFNKVALYNDYYDAGVYQSEWWLAYAQRFPVIHVVAETPVRLERIKETIERDNRNGLRFNLHLSTKLASDVVSCLTP